MKRVLGPKKMPILFGTSEGPYFDIFWFPPWVYTPTYRVVVLL